MEENEDVAENPQDASTENPPETLEYPPAKDDDEATGEGTENPQNLGGSFFEEVPADFQDQDVNEETTLEPAEDEQYYPVTDEPENEDPGNEEAMEDRPPPMAPSPAIFIPEDIPGTIQSPTIGWDELIPDRSIKGAAKVRDVPAAAAEKKETKPKQQTPKRQPTYPFRANMKTDKELYAALKQTPPPSHDYCGFIFSSITERPQGGYTNYFLPIYNQPQPKQHVQIAGLPIPTEVIHTKKTTQENILPLSTIKVTWISSRIRTIYRPESVYAYLSRFGPIDAIYSKSVNSVYVIFSDLEAAKAAVSCHHLGQPWDPLIAFWLEPRMYNSSFYHKYAAIDNPPQRIRI